MSGMVIFCRLALLSIALAQGVLFTPGCGGKAQSAPAAQVESGSAEQAQLHSDVDTFLEDFENS